MVYSVEQMWSKGNVRAAPVVALCQEWATANDTTLEEIGRNLGLAKSFFTKAATHAGMEFRIADRLLTHIGMTECWHSPDLREDYENVFLGDVKTTRKCNTVGCFVRIPKRECYCSDSCRDLQRGREKAYRARIKAEMESRKAAAGGS